MFPTERAADRPFDPPDIFVRLRSEQPVTPRSYPDGHAGWLVTGYGLGREVLADPRFSRRADLVHRPVRGGRDTGAPARPGAFMGMDPPEHTRYRRVLAGWFTTRRMRRLTDRIRQLATELLDTMDKHGPQADLVTAFAQPIPSQVICELLGVPSADRTRLQPHVATLFGVDLPREEVAAAVAALRDYLGELVSAKRAAPADGLLGGLATGDLSDVELINIGLTLLAAGLDTTANMLALGAYALIAHPGQVCALREPDAVEELLRYLSVVPYAARAALEDIELGGQLIKAGQTVTVSLPAANRDSRRFPDPDTLDLRKPAAGHVAFGHGIHQCLGQQLARVEIRVGLTALFERFPALRLAVPRDQVPMRNDMLTYGVHRLPVTWEV